MFRKTEVSRAVCIALATSAGLAAAPVMAEFEEIVVTATKRATDLQDTPIAIQALGEEKLDELNIGNFDDYIRYLPNVNAAGRGPGQSSIFIRGMRRTRRTKPRSKSGRPYPMSRSISTNSRSARVAEILTFT